MGKFSFRSWTVFASLVIAAAWFVSCGGDDDNNSSGNGNNDGFNNGNNGSISDKDNNLCASANVRASRIKPSILFVVDRSLSTQEQYPGSRSRWQAMYDALMAQNAGLIAKLQSVAYFGMVLYDSGDNAASCPRLIVVNPALNNYNAINAKYRQAQPAGYTPTALALEAAYKLVPRQSLDKEIGAQFVILCTDGEPNGCSVDGGARGGWLGLGGIPPTDYDGPVAQVTAAAKDGIKTYVIGIAVQDEAKTHLEELARLGDTGSPAFSPANKGDLVDTLSQIVGGAIGCRVRLNGEVTAGKECQGYVELNSQTLKCNDANGWKLADKSHIELQGIACKTFVSDPKAILNAGFPCDVFVIL
jgi:hypothetical protein